MRVRGILQRYLTVDRLLICSLLSGTLSAVCSVLSSVPNMFHPSNQVHIEASSSPNVFHTSNYTSACKALDFASDLLKDRTLEKDELLVSCSHFTEIFLDSITL